MGKENTTFVTAFGSSVDAIMYDVVHNANQDSQDFDQLFFPLARHKSWFDGHSFASGLFPFADGKSQESSSEAVNCYYGAYLWAMVSENGENYVDFSKLLLSMEIRGAQTYWHMMPSMEDEKSVANLLSTYTPDFAKNYMVGNVGMTDVTVSTWFGTESLYVHMINFMPVTGITRYLFSRGYIEKEYNAIIKPIKNVPMAWKGYTLCDDSISNSSSAWEEAKSIRSYELDSAISLTQVYFFISTNTHFLPSRKSGAKSFEDKPVKADKKSASPALCENHNFCEESGLKGFCCPTNGGAFLECCQSDSKFEMNKTNLSVDEGENKMNFSSARCENNGACSHLSGFCCPSMSGIYLKCCEASNSNNLE